MTLEIILSLLGILIGLSGWGVFVYERVTAGPRLRVRILNIMRGNTSLSGERYSTYLTYLYITNLRDHPVHILDYEMEADFGKGFIKLKRAYGIDNIPSYTFNNPEGKEIVIPDFQQKLIYKNAESIGFGQLYRGFILFVGDIDQYDRDVKHFRVTCTDAFNKRHRFTIASKDLGNLYLLQEMAGMSIPD